MILNLEAMEIIQVLLVITILVLTTILSIVGFEVFLILKEIRESVRKVNKILDDAGVISESVARPIFGLSDLTSGLRSLLGFIKAFIGERTPEIKEKKEKNEEEKNEEKQKESSSEPLSRRFFFRDGKRLS